MQNGNIQELVFFDENSNNRGLPKSENELSKKNAAFVLGERGSLFHQICPSLLRAVIVSEKAIAGLKASNKIC